MTHGAGSRSPDLRGKRVLIPAYDHPHSGKRGLVIDQVPCSTCGTECGYDDLVVQLADGSITRVYEPEADPS